MDRYIQFTQTKSTLLDNFNEDLLRINDSHCLNLHTIIKKYKQIKITFFETIVDDILCYIPMISSSSDDILIKLANEYHFPRGFNIFWIPGVSIEMNGFHPKFVNDKISDKNKNKNDFNPEELVNAVQLDFNFKYSGHLIQIFAFQINGNYYWTTCSKKSANNIYSQNAALIIQKHMTHDLLLRMYNDGIYFCGECMSFADQTHGAAVKYECLIVTCVGNSHRVIFNSYIEKPPTTDKFKFVNLFNQDNMQLFCIEYGLYVDNIYQITSQSNIQEFMALITEHRNILTLSEFRELCSKCPFIKIHSGNIDHNDVLGNVLEGLIIKIVNNTLPNKTIKFKVPFYTSRTMLLRYFLEQNNSQMNCSFITSIENFVNRWVIDYSNGKLYWTFILYTLYSKFDEFDKLYNQYTLITEDKNTLIGRHIFIMDKLFELPICKYDLTVDYYQEVLNFGFTKPENDISAIYALGSIGSGKSSISKLISSSNSQINHIDGDILCLDSLQRVLKLKEERNPLTQYLQVKSITENLIPIISCGGGQMLGKFNNKTENPNIEMFKHLRSIFSGTELASIILLPFKYDNDEYRSLEETSLYEFVEECSLFNSTNQVTEGSLLAQIKNIYDDEERFNEMYAERVKNNNWKMTDRDDLFNKSKQNFEVMTKIIQYGSIDNQIRKIILYPCITVSTYGQDMNRLYGSFKTFVTSEITTILSYNNMSYLPIPLFKQKRLLVEYGDNAHHITIKCNFKNPFETDNNHDFLQHRIVDGFIYYCPKKTVIDQIFSAIVELDKILTTLSQCEDQFDPKTLQNYKTINILINSCIDQITMIRTNQNYTNDIDLIAKVHKDLECIQQKLGAFKKFVSFDKDLIKSVINKKEKWFVAVILFSINESVFGDDLRMRAHVTMDSGMHEAFQMKDVAENINKGYNNFVLSLNNNKTNVAIDIEYTSCGYKPIPVKFCNIFYI